MTHQTVFHVPESDPAYGRRAFRNVRNLLDDETIDPDVVVVCNGGGIDHVLTDAPTAEAVRSMIEQGVTVSVCANTIDNSAHDPVDLLDGVAVVPTAMGELTRLQADGYAYVRP